MERNASKSYSLFPDDSSYSLQPCTIHHPIINQNFIDNVWICCQLQATRHLITTMCIYVYIYMDAYMFVNLGHVLFFSTTRNMVWQIIQHETPTSHLSPLSCHPANSHLNLSSATFHFSPLTSHLSPPHASQPSPLTSHAHRSPPTIPSHSHLQQSPGLWLSQTESHTRSHSDSESHTPTDTNSQSRSHSDTDSDIHPDLLTRCHTSLDNAQSTKTWNTSCKTKSTTNLTNSAMIYVCPKQHLIHTLNTRNLSKPPRCFFVCF